MNFTPIDLQSLLHSQMFYYFSKMAPTGYSNVVNVNVTELRELAKEQKIKFFSLILGWLPEMAVCF